LGRAIPARHGYQRIRTIRLIEGQHGVTPEVGGAHREGVRRRRGFLAAHAMHSRGNCLRAALGSRHRARSVALAPASPHA
jgi:hypothetical protein